jgi:hypothetical protein
MMLGYELDLEHNMPLKNVKREEFERDGDEVTHAPTGKKYSAHPGRPEIANENMVDVADYREYEIKEMAAKILAERLKA